MSGGLNRFYAVVAMCAAAAAVMSCMGRRSVAEADAPSVAPAEPLPEGAVAMHYDRHMIFDAAVRDSVPARLVFDTGASMLYLDSLWVETSGMTFEKVSGAMQPGVGEDVERVRLVMDTVGFSIDTAAFVSIPSVLLDVKGILGRGADGIFGLPSMGGMCVAFDVERGYMRSVSADTLASAGYERISGRADGGRIYVPMRVEIDPSHTVEGEFLLDTGCAGAIAVTAPAARAAGFDGYEGPKVGFCTSSGGVGGESRETVCRASAVSAGTMSVRDIPVSVSHNGSGALASGSYCGLTGMGFLGKFDFAIDFASGSLWLRPTARTTVREVFATAGFKVIDRSDICDGWPVTGLYEGHAPEGLRIDDVVIECDGRKAAETDTGVLDEAGPHALKVRRGGEVRELTVETREIL